MQKEYKVGEKIKLGNVTLVVEGTKDYGCDGCFFKRLCQIMCENDVIEMVGGCLPSERINGDNVIFAKVEEE